jgi:hypothetical protein
MRGRYYVFRLGAQASQTARAADANNTMGIRSIFYSRLSSFLHVLDSISPTSRPDSLLCLHSLSEGCHPRACIRCEYIQWASLELGTRNNDPEVPGLRDSVWRELIQRAPCPLEDQRIEED